jgi:hypothetical protein
MNVVYLSDAEYQDWLKAHGGHPGVSNTSAQTTQQQQQQ